MYHATGQLAGFPAFSQYDGPTGIVFRLMHFVNFATGRSLSREACPTLLPGLAKCVISGQEGYMRFTGLYSIGSPELPSVRE